MKHSLLIASLVVTIAALAGLVAPVLDATGGRPQSQKVRGQVRPDAALVYVWAPDEPRAQRIFCDDRLVAVVNKKDYAISYVSPGTHVFWVNGFVWGIADFSAGRTYYIRLHWTRNWAAMSTLSEAEGEARIDGSNRQRELTEKQRVAAAGTIAKHWPKHKVALARKLEPVGDQQTYVPPRSTEGMVRIPAGTAVRAEVMENISSAAASAGDGVWVRTVDDIHIEGRVVVRANTPMKALVRDAKRKGGGVFVPGYLDLTVLSVAAADGTLFPLIGQIARCPGRKSEWPNVVATLVGGLPGAIVVNFARGSRDAFIPAGEQMEAYSRHETWIGRVDATPDGNASTPGAGEPLKAYAPAEPVCEFARNRTPQVLKIVFRPDADWESVELTAVAGSRVPTPVRARTISHSDGAVVAEFSDSDVCRFLRFGNAGAPLTFRMSGRDGAVATAQGTVPATVK